MSPRLTTCFRSARRGPHRHLAFAAAFCIVATLCLAAAPAHATLTSIGTRPDAPTTCESVDLLVAGTMPGPCYRLIGAEIEGPVPLETLGPIPAYGIRVKLTVQEPNPLLGAPCPAVIQPYSQQFLLGKLPFGSYWVSATEYLVPFRGPFDPDSLAEPTDSSFIAASFFVSTEPCLPGPGCYILSFGGRNPSPHDSCSGGAPPGGTACVDVTLLNERPVGGLQTAIELFFDPRPGPLCPFCRLPGDIAHPISVETTERAAGFQVAWTAEGSRTKLLLFSPSGAAIEPGRGPILRVCYAIGAETPEGAYPMRFEETVVADISGVALPACPTIAEIIGRLCVSKPGCDLNGDGVSDIRDVILLVNCALSGGVGGTVHCPDPLAGKADCNGDGVLDVRDVICCVRKILAGGGFGSGGGPSDPSGTNATRIGFMGSVRWLTPVLGRATIEVNPGAGFAGIQFGINAAGSRARIRDLRLSDPADGYQLESSIDPGGGGARAMLLSLDSGGAAGPVRLEVTVEPAVGGGGLSGLELTTLRSATRSAEEMTTLSSSPTAEVPPSPPTSAPAVSAPVPNPFAAETEIAYSLPAQRQVTLRVYNASGRLVRTLVDATMPAGVHRARWDGRDSGGRDTGSGLYFMKFSTGDVERTNRLLRLR